MIRRARIGRVCVVGAVALIVSPAVYCFSIGSIALLTQDQRGYNLFAESKYDDAAEQFTDAMWKGVAFFRAGDFEQAAGVFAGYDTAEGAFDQGNALVMLGRYQEAADRYKRALKLRPGWEPASVNLEIARARARALEKKGGEMTGGKLEADEIVFTKGKAPKSAGEEQVDGGQKLSEAEVRAMWLRQVQTKPADFLRAKFAYQLAMRGEGGD